MHYSKLYHRFFSPVGLISFLALCLFGFTACAPKKKESAAVVSLRADVTFLSDDTLKGREIGSEGERQAAAYIVERFRSVGLIPSGSSGYYQPFEVTPSMNPHAMPEEGKEGDTTIQSNNIVGSIDNTGDRIVIIGAHYDHLGYGGESSLQPSDTSIHNGADDNASGVAATIWLAHQLKQQRLSKDLVFIAFSGEEKGLWGSNYFCKNPTIDLSKVDAMINLDMVGRLDEKRGLAIHGMGTSPSWPDIIDKANTDSLHLVLRESGVGPSDHTSFYLQDIPVLHFFTGQHEDYHKPGDDADKINYQGMKKITAMIERIVEDINTQRKLSFTKTKDESMDRPRFSVTLGVVPDYLFDGRGMRIDGIREDKPAQKAGMQKGDVVVKMGDLEVTDMESYMKALAAFKKGDQISVTVIRADNEMVMTVMF